MAEGVRDCAAERQEFYPYPVKIAGVGRCLPTRVVYTTELESSCVFERGSHRPTHGVEQRRWVDAETQSAMGAEAAKEAVQSAGVRLSDLDLIVNASMSFERKIPDGGPLLQRQLGLHDSGIPCISIQLSDLSFLAAVDVATSLMDGCDYRSVLIVSSEVLSPILDSCCPEAYTLFGDGAAAVVLTKARVNELSCIHRTTGESYGAQGELMQSLYGYAAAHQKLQSQSELALRIEMDAFVEQGVLRTRQLLDKLCTRRMQESLELVILQDWGKEFQGRMTEVVPEHKLIWMSRYLGHCGAASLPMALYEAVTARRLKRGDQFLMAGFGAGLSLQGMLLTY